MKKLLLTLLLLILLVPSAFAAKRVDVKQLTINGANVNGYSISSGGTVTSDSIYQTGNLGFQSLYTGVNGNVTISEQVSFDNVNWFTPNTTDGTNLTAVGTIVSNITSNKWIILTARLAPYIRFIYVSTGASTITADTLWQTES